ncbi:MAG: hypothetical protein AAGE79_14575 [Acinetobacter pittii]
MTQIEQFFAEAKKLNLSPQSVGFTPSMVEEYIAQYGYDRAMGYVHALNNVFQGLEHVLYKYKALDRKGLTHEPFKARSNLVKFMNHSEDVLKICNEIVSYDPPPKCAIG